MSLPSSLILGIHIVMAMLLVGGGLAALFSGGATISVLPRRSALIGIVLLLVTGVNNLIMRMGTGVPKGYHMWFGIKFLLALHILSMTFIVTGPQHTPEKRARLLKGVGVSAIAVVLISVYLNYLVTGLH
jgi:hypothetical protein